MSENIAFPDNFPSKEEMLNILHKTIEKSWKTDIALPQIENWLSNFVGEIYNIQDEQRLALWLLCNYTYYSSNDVNHLCKVLFNKFIHDFVKRNNINIVSIEEAMEKVCYASIGSASESGGLLLYHFRQEANLSMDRFFYPTDIEESEETTVVFVDDVTLSGGTGCRNYYQQLINKKYKNIYYLTIIASDEAVKKLEEMGIIVIYCALVDDRNKCFSDESMVFHRYKDLIEPAKNIAKHYGEKIVDSPVKPLGFKNGEFCFGFYYNTPNNTLPLFWSEKNWQPIFIRKEKIKNDRQFHYESNRYI